MLVVVTWKIVKFSKFFIVLRSILEHKSFIVLFVFWLTHCIPIKKCRETLTKKKLTRCGKLCLKPENKLENSTNIFDSENFVNSINYKAFNEKSRSQENHKIVLKNLQILLFSRVTFLHFLKCINRRPSGSLHIIIQSLRNHEIYTFLYCRNCKNNWGLFPVDVSQLSALIYRIITSKRTFLFDILLKQSALLQGISHNCLLLIYILCILGCFIS